MGRQRRSFILGLLFALTCLSPLRAQTGNKGASDSNATAASPTSTGQAPDEVTRKLTDLVHAGKYTEAQQLTTGLLAAYPNDQRLIKAKAVIEKMLSSASQAAPGSSQPVARADAVQLAGMDKVNYSALIVLARQAKKTTDRSEQQTLLQQFMDQSSAFLQKFPDQMLLWQLRAATAISLNDPTAGYEAGQKLIAAGAADSDDSNLQELLGQLKNKHWLDAAEAKRQAKYDWIVGTWTVVFSYDGLAAISRSSPAAVRSTVQFFKSATVLEGHSFLDGIRTSEDPSLLNTLLNSAYRGTILGSEEIRWEWTQNLPDDASGWLPAISFASSEDRKTMTIVFSSSKFKSMGACTVLFRRIDSQE